MPAEGRALVLLRLLVSEEECQLERFRQWDELELGGRQERLGDVAAVETSAEAHVSRYAIEDYEKARLLEHGNDWRGKGHDVPWLVREACVELEKADQVLLRRLKEVVTWAGRYSAPLRPEEFVLGRGDQWSRGAFESDFAAIDRICELLTERWDLAERSRIARGE
jgi:hypothetical protein